MATNLLRHESCASGPTLHATRTAYERRLSRCWSNERRRTGSAAGRLRSRRVKHAFASILAALLPDESEAHGLAALMELQASRTRARISPSGDQVLLLDQDRSRWDWLLVGRGLAALERAHATGGPLGPYTLQAAIAACHARARAADDTDWERIVALYDGLAQLTPSPVVELNRAVAIGMAFGPRAALEIVDALRREPALGGYPLLPSVRGDLLEKLGRLDEARAEFERAALLTANSRQRGALLARATACAAPR
jgi:RNA polymerase sigma-70 factor, ECF subfamily